MGGRITINSVTAAGKKLLRSAERFKYPLVILSIGIVLLCLPTTEREHPTPQQAEEPVIEQDLEYQLEEILSRIEGVGQTKVLLTLETGPQTLYQEDLEQRIRSEDQESSTTTVFVSEDGKETPVVVKTIYPIYKGALVVCQGAGSAAVRLHIVQAVSSLTGLGSDKITVIKMKG